MSTKIYDTRKSNISQPSAREACSECKAQRCCGSCWCCYGPWPSVARLTKAALDAVCGDGYDWLSPRVVPGFAGPVNLSEVCG